MCDDVMKIKKWLMVPTITDCVSIWLLYGCFGGGVSSESGCEDENGLWPSNVS